MTDYNFVICHFLFISLEIFLLTFPLTKVVLHKGKQNSLTCGFTLGEYIRRRRLTLAGKISEERYIKMSDNYEVEQKTLTERLNFLKAEIEKAKTQYDNIQRFLAIVKKYSDFDELTPEILRAFVDKVIIHEKVKVDGRYVHTIEIIYNFVEAIDLPDFDRFLEEEN